MNRLKEYNRVLGIKSDVTAEELRAIYRRRAKELHPDRNKNPASHEDFILLGEAYSFYSQLLEQLNERQKTNVFRSKKYPERYYKEAWNVEKRMAARKRASERAKARYQEFEDRGYHKRLDRLFYIFDIVRFIFALLLLFCLPVFLFLQDQFRGLIIALFIQLITYKLWSRAIKRFIPSR